MSEAMYKAIAKKNGVSVKEVKKEMQAAINAAFVFPTPEAEGIPRKNDIPTIEEFFKFVAEQIAKNES